MKTRKERSAGKTRQGTDGEARKVEDGTLAWSEQTRLCVLQESITGPGVVLKVVLLR